VSDVRPEHPTGLALVKTWSERVRLPIVYASVGLVIMTLYLGGFLGPVREFLLPAAMGVLIAFGIQSLQTIERQTGPERIKEFADEETALGELARLVSGDKKVTRVKVIAATGWTTVHRILPALMSQSRSPRVELDMQVIDAEGPLRDAYPRHWAHEAEETLRELDKLSRGGRLTSSVSAYLFLPPIHGILLDDHFLLVGTFGWTEPESGRVELVGAESPHRLYARGDPTSAQLFELFDGWFEHVPSRPVYPRERVAATAATTGAVGGDTRELPDG
jgi:hypothetical protein